VKPGVEKWARLVEQMRGVEYQFGLITPDAPTFRIGFAEGLSDTEVSEIEGRFGFHFPSDLRDFLQTALPVGPRFPDWRSGDHDDLQEWLNWPIEGVLTDVHNNERCWLPEWGERPANPADAVALVDRLLEDAPRLIPLYGHRMMPDAPTTPGNPIFSVYGTDIICYGVDLETYWRNEFQLPGDERPAAEPRAIKFWSALAA
jgi:hypothetical protein